MVEVLALLLLAGGHLHGQWQPLRVGD
jgi:hypothetical protein